jgi:SH3-like domain-containing protein
MRIAILSAVAALSAAVFASAQFTAEPEYLCVSAKEAKVYKGPRDSETVSWKMWKFFPVEVVSYRGDWVKIRDFEGDTGWVKKAAVSGMACVQTRKKDAVLRKSPGGAAVWVLDRGYPFRLFSVKGDWVEVSDLETATGWLPMSAVWGAPRPKE